MFNSFIIATKKYFSKRSDRFNKASAAGGAVLIICFFLFASYPSGASATTQTGPLHGNHVLTGDLEITFQRPPGMLYGYGVVSVDAGQSIIGAPGALLSIDITSGPNGEMLYAVLAEAGGLVSVDKLYISAGEGNSFPDENDIYGVFSKGGTIRMGDGSKIYAYNNGMFGVAAVMATTGDDGSGGYFSGLVEIGDNAVLYSKSDSSHENATVVATAESEFHTDGGRVSIGDYAKIINEADMGDFVRNSYHTAVLAKTSGEVIIGDHATIASNGWHDNHVVYAYGAWNKLFGKITIGKSADITSYGEYDSSALYSYGGYSVISIDEYAKITTYGENSSGAFADNGGEISIGGGSVVETNETSANGLYAFGNNQEFVSLISTGENVDIYTNESASKGVLAKSFAGGNSRIDMGAGNKVETSGYEAHGLMATMEEIIPARVIPVEGGGAIISSDTGVRVATTGDEAHGAYALSGGAIYLGEETIIRTSGNESHGAIAFSSQLSDKTSEITIAADSYINVSGSDSYGIYALNGGTIGMGGATIIADTALGGMAIVAENNGFKKSLVHGDGVFSIYGDIAAIDSSEYGSDVIWYSSIDLTLQAGSLFTGAAALSGDNVFSGLTINGVNSLWNVTDHSELSSLTLDDSTVDFSASGLGTVLTSGVLNTENSGAGGLLSMKTDIVGGIGDKLIITEESAGSHKITVHNMGSAGTDGTERLTIVETPDGTGQFALLNGTTDIGAYQYGLRIAENTVGNWELYSLGASAPGSGGVNTFYANYLLSYAETQTLIQRLGDLRDTPLLSGFWFRAHGGKFESNAKSFVKPFDMDYWGVQIGYDRKVDIGWDGDFYAGVMFGYSKGDLDYLTSGSGNVDSKTFGVYGTFTHPSGFFADLVLKYQWMDNEFDVLDSDGGIVTGDDVTTGGFGASLELGQRIHFEKGGKSGWYVEPQVQLSYMRQDGGYFNASNGLRIGVESFTSVLGRLGLLIGHETENTNFYAKVSKVREFDGDVIIMANSRPVSESFGGGWWVYGLGFTSRINDRNSIYLDIERASGGSFTQTWAAKAGWRIEF